MHVLSQLLSRHRAARSGHIRRCYAAVQSSTRYGANDVRHHRRFFISHCGYYAAILYQTLHRRTRKGNRHVQGNGLFRLRNRGEFHRIRTRRVYRLRARLRYRLDVYADYIQSARHRRLTRNNRSLPSVAVIRFGRRAGGRIYRTRLRLRHNYSAQTRARHYARHTDEDKKSQTQNRREKSSLSQRVLPVGARKQKDARVLDNVFVLLLFRYGSDGTVDGKSCERDYGGNDTDYRTCAGVHFDVYGNDVSRQREREKHSRYESYGIFGKGTLRRGVRRIYPVRRSRLCDRHRIPVRTVTAYDKRNIQCRRRNSRIYVRRACVFLHPIYVCRRLLRRIRCLPDQNEPHSRQNDYDGKLMPPKQHL